MISRRNIRINVFQAIYETNQQETELNASTALKNLDDKFQKTSSLFVAITQLLYALSQYVLIYANQKASKMAPTADDLRVSTKLAGNILIEQLKRNTSFGELVKKYRVVHLFENEMLKSLFTKLTQTAEYRAYTSHENRTATEEKAILQTILDTCIFGDEDTASFMAEHYMNWYNDYEMLYSWTEKLLMNTKGYSFEKIISKDKLEYAHDLLKCYYDKKELVFKLIEPKLVNWDPERIASIDMIILHLGICEFLFFPTIPVKVTINEYIDLAKSYSTPLSGQFVNGLLDNVRKDLENNEQLYKTQYIKK